MADFTRGIHLTPSLRIVLIAYIFALGTQTVTAVTSPPTPSINTTVTPTTTPATTTTITPQGTPSPIAPDTDIPGCPCDLTGNSCDAECCCDPDCSASDREAFRICLNYSYQVDDRACFPQRVFFSENSPVISSSFNSDLFCINTDNNARRNYYTVPDLVTTQDKFDEYLSRYPQYIYNTQVTDSATFPAYYQSGGAVYVVFQDRSRGTLALPRSLGSTFCTNSNPAAVLVSASHSCVQELPSLAQACQSRGVLDAATYYSLFRVVTIPDVFNRNISIDAIYTGNDSVAVTVGTLLCQQPSGLVGPCGFTAPPTPGFSGSTCSNAVVQVTYRVVYQGQSGIRSVAADFVFANVTAAATGSTLLSQTFGTNFRSTTDGDSFPRSGRPGYQIGQPVMAGILNQTTNADGTVVQQILLNQDSSQWMTVATASATGSCLTDYTQRASIRFGEDMRTGCLLSVTNTSLPAFCALLQESIINAIEGVQGSMADSAKHVATFGDSDVSKVGDWIPILVSRRPTPQQANGLQCALSLGAHIQFLYSNVGSISNPQPKIIGISYVYQAIEDITFRCIGPFCQPGQSGLTQNIEVTSSVSFLDVSVTPTGIQAEAPVFIAKVPYDFFYPFLTGAAQAPTSSVASLLLVSVAAALLRSLALS